MKQSARLVFIPSPGIGHLVSTVELAKLLLSRDDLLSISVLIFKFPSTSTSVDETDAYTKSFSDSSLSQRLNFINLPQLTIETKGYRTINFMSFIGDYKPHVKAVVAKLMHDEPATRIGGFVVDMFCVAMIDVANELHVPSYVFFTSSAAVLGLMFHLQAIRDDNNKDHLDYDSNVDLTIPTYANPLPTSVLPDVLFEKLGGNALLEIAKRAREVKSVLVNTYTNLEPHALQTLGSDSNLPPMHPVGPILNVKSDDDVDDSMHSMQKSNITTWLDDQPRSSVVFLCFGSIGCFSKEQVKEIALALENGGFRFLWSLRQPPPKGTMDAPTDYADPTAVLPLGFLDRTADVGRVIGWAPQVDILAHRAVGGFVSHCGWNSTLESLWFGVPIATWPLYAEQQVNAFQLVKDLGLGVEIDMSYRKDGKVVVKAEKIERGIKEVMEVDGDVRRRVKRVSEDGRRALMPGGSSYVSLGNFIDQI